MPNNTEVEIRSEQVQDILNKVPRWMIRWGSTLICAIIIGLFTSLFFIEYPDIVQAKIVITTPLPPINIVSKSSGKIQYLFKENGQFVAANEWIAIIENPANYENIKQLSQIITHIEDDTNKIQAILATDFPYLDIAEIQQTYNSLIKSITQFKNLKETDNLNFQLDINTKKDKNYKQLLRDARNQLAHNVREVQIMAKKFNRNKSLHEEGVISKKELEDAELVLINAKKTYENTQSSIIRLKSEKQQIRKENKTLTNSESESILNYKLQMLEAYNQTRLQFKSWEDKYVLKAPIQGKINFFDIRSKNQFIQTGDKLCTILPDEEQQILGISKMPSKNSGKVKPKQKVLVKLDAYPHAQFGVLTGQLMSISELPDDNNEYQIKVSFPNQLKTNYNKNIAFKQALNGTADIITENLTLAERIFFNFKNILNKW